MTGATWEREVAENARRLGALRDRLSAQTIREVSRDGTVEVSVATSGALTGLVLREGRFREPLPVIAAQVMDCVRRAQARIPELMGQAMAETVGPHDPAAQLILAETRERFPAPPAPRSGDAPAPPPARPAQDGDDWDGPEIFERG
ncbi:YbaB/EbfC family nucleoid-associated protein [Lentzea sp. CA-135723]|uniref:YbaB/EbfC family nucleoid-associated protein n=1 Tax=Lentzea sp. CA-135723 TaxID=3239950 RepID=UPI003D8F61BC